MSRGNPAESAISTQGRALSATPSARRILIEANKIAEGSRDGCFRYAVELSRAVEREVGQYPRDFDIDTLIRGRAYPLGKIPELLRYDWNRRSEVERRLINLLVRFRQSIADDLRRRLPKNLTATVLRLDRVLGVTRVLSKRHVGSPFDPREYDLVHLALPQAYRSLVPRISCPLVVTIHDCTHLRHPQFHLQTNVQETEKGIQYALKQGAHFLSVSRTSASDFMAAYDVPPNRVTTTPLATDLTRFRPITDPSVVKPTLASYGVPDAPYFLALSTLEPRKNLRNTIRAFDELQRNIRSPIQLVVAGRKGWKYDEIFKESAASLNGICFTGFLREKDLPVLYSNALGLVFASYYEGFGLPALEAMACGTGVVFGNVGALPEVVGEAGIPVEPSDPRDIALGMRYLYESPELRRRLGEKGRQRAAGFSWAHTARKTLDVYEEIFARSSARAVG